MGEEGDGEKAGSQEDLHRCDDWSKDSDEQKSTLYRFNPFEQARSGTCIHTAFLILRFVYIFFYFSVFLNKDEIQNQI